MGALERTPLILTYRPRAFSLGRSVTDTANRIRRSPFACMALSLSWGLWRVCSTRRRHSTRLASTPCCARTGRPMSPSCLWVWSLFSSNQLCSSHPTPANSPLLPGKLWGSGAALGSLGVWEGGILPSRDLLEMNVLPWSLHSGCFHSEIVDRPGHYLA